MIVSIAHASVDDPDAEYIFGAWSNIVIGARPGGLIDCYLARGDDAVHMVSIWESAEDHHRAIGEEGSHPAFGFFDACGLDPSHTTYDVIGRLKHRAE